MKKRLLSILITAALLLTLVPAFGTPALAVETGVCGDGLTWWIDVDGSLTIAGTGAMDDWSSGGAPWYHRRADITSISISADCTSVGSYAFEGCTALDNVFLTGSMAVGDHAFSGCTGLIGVDLPVYLSAISDGLFEGCTALTSLIMPSTVSTVGAGAFSGCAALESILVSLSTETIGENAFAGCVSLTDVHYNGRLAQWNAIEIAAGNEALTNAVLHYVVTEGQLTDTLWWEIDEDENLTIYGAGAMPDFDGIEDTPWYHYSGAWPLSRSRMRHPCGQFCLLRFAERDGRYRRAQVLSPRLHSFPGCMSSPLSASPKDCI
jgi:hypothetical protein